MSTTTSGSVVRSARGGWVTASVALLFLYVGATVFSTAAVWTDEHRVIVPEVIVGLLALGLAVALMTRPLRAVAIAAALLMVVAIVGSGPPHVVLITSGVMAKEIFGVVDLAIMAAALVVTGLTAWRWESKG